MDKRRLKEDNGPRDFLQLFLYLATFLDRSTFQFCFNRKLVQKVPGDIIADLHVL